MHTPSHMYAHTLTHALGHYLLLAVKLNILWVHVEVVLERQVGVACSQPFGGLKEGELLYLQHGR